MKLSAALVFSFCMGLHGNSQTTNKAEVDRGVTQRIADPSCDTASSSRPGLSQDQLVKAIIDQTIAKVSSSRETEFTGSHSFRSLTAIALL